MRSSKMLKTLNLVCSCFLLSFLSCTLDGFSLELVDRYQCFKVVSGCFIACWLKDKIIKLQDCKIKMGIRWSSCGLLAPLGPLLRTSDWNRCDLYRSQRCVTFIVCIPGHLGCWKEWRGFQRMTYIDRQTYISMFLGILFETFEIPTQFKISALSLN